MEASPRIACTLTGLVNSAANGAFAGFMGVIGVVAVVVEVEVFVMLVVLVVLVVDSDGDGGRWGVWKEDVWVDLAVARLGCLASRTRLDTGTTGAKL